MYNSYFGFRESPFSVTPDPRFFYTNQVYLEAFATLRYGIEAKKGFIVITGEAGTGKTTLLRKLLHSFEDTIHSVFVFNSSLSFPDLLQLTLHDLGLVPKDQSKVGMLLELDDYLIKQLKDGHTVAMLIDEAQNLSDDVMENLRLLSNLETDQEKLIQFVLMGQPELQAKLAQPHLRQLKQRVALQCRLEPLTDKETAPYIEARLMAAGYEGGELFHPDAVERIAHYSRGIPRVMNVICDNALLYAYATSRQTVSADMIETVARDFELRQLKPAVAEPRDVPMGMPPKVETATAQQATPFQHLSSQRIRTGVGAFLAMLILVVGAAVIDSRKLLGTVRKELGSANKLNHWQVPVSQSEALSKKPRVEADSKRQYRRVIIQPGATVQKIAADTYGRDTNLGMDLIKEFNPQIQNLNRVMPGQELLLVPLSQETLLREQADGSYHLIVASFSRGTDAQAHARALGDQGYKVVIKPSRISDDLLLQRVEIVGLKNLKTAMQTWDIGLSKKWFTFAASQSGGEQLSRVETAY